MPASIPATINRLDHTFRGASIFNQPIGTWDTTGVTLTRGMFSGASAFNQNIGDWNTANVTNMFEMFKNATSFNQPLANWIVF